MLGKAVRPWRLPVRIDGAARRGDDAEVWYRQLRAGSLEPDAVTYTSLIKPPSHLAARWPA